MKVPVDALVITCMDARLHRADTSSLAAFLRGKHAGLKSWDLLAVAGGIQDIVSPAGGGRSETVFRGVQVAHERHQVTRIFLVNHSDCSEYGGASAFGDAADEYRKHAEDLRAARQVLRDRIPNLDVRLWYATVEDRSDGPFVTFDEVR